MQTLARQLSRIVMEGCNPHITGVAIARKKSEKLCMGVNLHNVCLDLFDGTPRSEGRLRREPPRGVVVGILTPIPEPVLARITRAVDACKTRLKADSSVGYILPPARNHIIIEFQGDAETLAQVFQTLEPLQARFPPKRFEDLLI